MASAYSAARQAAETNVFEGQELLEKRVVERTAQLRAANPALESDWSQCQRLIRGEITSFELEKRYIRKDGAIVWVYLNCSGVYDAEGKLIHFLTYIQDISDKKRAEDALRISEEKWRRGIETDPIGIAISRVDGKVLDSNTTAWTILGYDSKEDFLRFAASVHYLDPADRPQRIENIKEGYRPTAGSS